ncbi:MAG: TolB family protein [Bacteriovoracaceae bacterium]
MKYLNFLFWVFVSFSTLAQSDLTVVAVGEAELETDRLMVYSAKGANPPVGLANDILEIVRNDFSFYKNSFTVMKSLDSGDGVSMDDFAKEKYSYVVQAEATGNSNAIDLKIKIINVRTKSELSNLNLKVLRQNLRSEAHQISTEIYKAMTGKTGIFKAKITFVSDKGASPKRYFKELYVMDFDGQNVKKLTNHQGIVISPTFNYDNSKIAYSLISKNRADRNIGLYIYDLKTGDSHLISNQKGINSGAVFTPDHEHLITTLSFSGNSELYRMDLEGKNLTKITNNSADDVDPTLSSDGTKMAFLSDRSGKAMIYVADPSATEKNVKRVSFIGKFNATPSFSPDGKNIVFSSWDKTFDIYRITSDGAELFRLTKDFGSNEDPSYSLDGEFIIFTSKRVKSRSSAEQDIYIMDKNGEVIGGLTQGISNCTTPRWSK